MYYKSKSYRIFYNFNLILLAFLALLCILPLIHVLAVSLSGAAAANNYRVGLWPVDFTMRSYAETITNPQYLNSMWIAVKRVVAGTAIAMGLTILLAYPLSKPLKGKSIVFWLLVFTMLFQAGIIPNYILIKELGLMGSFWSLIFPTSVVAFYIILVLNFFKSIPKELEEAAAIDGAGHFRVLVLIFLPLSLPSLATISLFNIVLHWNEWFLGLLYLQQENYPLSTFLRTVIVQIDPNQIKSMSADELRSLSQRALRSSQVFLGALPVILIYPFIQRFFVKGMVLGAVKE